MNIVAKDIEEMEDSKTYRKKSSRREGGSLIGKEIAWKDTE